MIDKLPDYWPIFAAGMAGLIWLIRLEAKILYMEKASDKNEEALWSKLNDVQALILQLIQSVGELKGKVSRD